MKIDVNKFKGLCGFKKVSREVIQVIDSNFILSGTVERTSKNYYKVKLLLRTNEHVQRSARSLREAEEAIFDTVRALRRKYEQGIKGTEVLPGQIGMPL